MRLAWNKTSLVLTVSKDEAFQIRAELPIPVSRYRLISNRSGKVMLTADGTGNELKPKAKSNSDDEVLFQTSADSLDNNLPRFWQMTIPDTCLTLREDRKGLIIDVVGALALRPPELLAKPERVLRIAGRGEPKPTLKRATSTKSDFVPTPDWIEDRMAEAADETKAIVRLEALQQADIAILEGLVRRINGLRLRHPNNVSFVIRPGGYIGLRLASRVEIDCTPTGA